MTNDRKWVIYSCAYNSCFINSHEKRGLFAALFLYVPGMTIKLLFACREAINTRIAMTELTVV